MSFYYDANIFGASVNEAHRSYLECRRVTDPAKISWTVVLSIELINAETSYEQLVKNFFTQMSLQGKEVIDVALAETRLAKKTRRKLISDLRGAGLSAMDVNHVFCALISAKFIGTDDDDFWDPRIKAGHNGNAVQNILEAIPLPPVRPAFIR